MAKAKKKADPSYQPKASKTAEVHIDPPTIALLPGNVATFWAETDGAGLHTVTVVTARDSWTGTPSISGGRAKVTKLIETGHGDITVSFSEDGVEYASGTFTV